MRNSTSIALIVQTAPWERRIPSFASCTSPIIHHVFISKFCLTDVSNFPGVLHSRFKPMLMLLFFSYGMGRGANKVFYGRCANGEYQITDLFFSHSIAKKYIQEGAHPFLSFSLYFISLYQKEMHWPGIEPGPPAWQARILPLNH